MIDFDLQKPSYGCQYNRVTAIIIFYSYNLMIILVNLNWLKYTLT